MICKLYIKHFENKKIDSKISEIILLFKKKILSILLHKSKLDLKSSLWKRHKKIRYYI